MDREFKIALGLLIFLLGIGTVLLEWLARIHFYQPEFIRGFLPFALLLAPYILFSTEYCLNSLRARIDGSWWKKLIFPLYLLSVYSIFSRVYGTFQWTIFYRLAAWLLAPTALFSFGSAKLPFHGLEFLAALMLWLPLEYGQLPGFDIIFTEGIQIPALAFAAPCLGLYLFAALRGLPDIGFNFRWRLTDALRALVTLALLALILIPMGTHLGFIRYSAPQTSIGHMVELLFGIYFLVALPEELLFRGIFQNLLMKTFGPGKGSWAALALASVIFGFSHYNNFNPPDWRYVFLASIAGFFYGWNYWKSGRTTISAIVHCGVNFFWAVLFRETGG